MVMRADLAEKIHPCQRASGLRGSGLVGPVHPSVITATTAGGVGLNAEEGADRIRAGSTASWGFASRRMLAEDPPMATTCPSGASAVLTKKA